jgi:hypothetical protein
MAVAIISEVPDGTADMYDAVNRKLEEDGMAAQEGHVIHLMWLNDGGFTVFDVWESEDQHERFVQEALGPAIEEVVGPDVLSVTRTVHQLHNVMQ